MSLLDGPDVTLRAGNAFIRNSLIRYQFDGDGIQTGDNIIFNGYCALLSKVDAFYQPNIQGLPLFYNIRDYVKVVFSAKRPHYGERYNDDSFSDVLILGKYVASDPDFGECVILYVNNISECSRSKISFETLMLAVYIHELYHVYFRSGDNYILDVNQKYLQHDYFTDIITFDYCESDKLSGDLFISVDTVRENAAEYGSDFREELSRVIVHGLLHLIGNDDHCEEDIAEMRSKENYYLSLRELL